MLEMQRPAPSPTGHGSLFISRGLGFILLRLTRRMTGAIIGPLGPGETHRDCTGGVAIPWRDSLPHPLDKVPPAQKISAFPTGKKRCRVRGER